MKHSGKIILIICCIINISFRTTVNAQGMGINNVNPHASAILDLTATNKGFLAPRMTAVQRNAIPAPATGLLVFDTSLNNFYFYNSTAWQQLGGSLGWELTGNAGTNPLINFLGTADNQPLVFKINNQPAGYIDHIDGAFTGRNTFYGKLAGSMNTSGGYENTFVGHKTGEHNTTGDFNTGIGSFALQDLTTGYSNLALGAQAMMRATSNFQNCAVGIGAMTFATSGFYNHAFGYHAMFNTASAGIGNHAFGFEALLNNTGAYNCAYGQTSMRANINGNYNAAFGSSALYNNTTGNNNTAMGELALVNNTSGNFNTVYGSRAAYTSMTGNGIVAIGDSALYANVSSGNTAVGSRALRSNSNGLMNTSVGSESLYLNSTGNTNTAIGVNASRNQIIGSNNVAVGAFSLQNNLNNYNTSVGVFSGSVHNNYSYGTFVGYGADASSSGLTNITAVGSGAIAVANNQVKLGNSFVTTIGGAVNWSIISDARFKKDVRNDVAGLDFILELKPVTYKYDILMYRNYTGESKMDINGNVTKLNNKEFIRYSGFLAQEVEQAAVRAGYDFSGVHHPENETDTYMLSYAEFVVPLVKAVQELNSKIELLEKQNSELRSGLLKLQNNKPDMNADISISSK
ncbi:MAG: tail fiber domain-containing protein [Bacteroidetes bacterium]|nr:tail fiber domain-containing protein [Bacteroidota bacterium]